MHESSLTRPTAGNHGSGPGGVHGAEASDGARLARRAAARVGGVHRRLRVGDALNRLGRARLGNYRSVSYSAHTAQIRNRTPGSFRGALATHLTNVASGTVHASRFTRLSRRPRHALLVDGTTARRCYASAPL